MAGPAPALATVAPRRRLAKQGTRTAPKKALQVVDASAFAQHRGVLQTIGLHDGKQQLH